MQATDVTPTRLEAAKAAAIDALKDLPAGGKVSVIAAGRTAKVVANGTERPRHASGRRSRPSSRPPTSATWATPCGWPRPWRPDRATPRSSSRRTPRSRRRPAARSRHRSASSRSAARRTTRRSSRSPSGRRPAASRTARSSRWRTSASRSPSGGSSSTRTAAARVPDAHPRPAAPDRRLDRRHRRPGPPGVGRRGPARRQGRGRHRRAADAARRRRPGLGDRAARRGRERSSSSSERRPVPRDRALLPARHGALGHDARRLRERRDPA